MASNVSASAYPHIMFMQDRDEKIQQCPTCLALLSQKITEKWAMHKFNAGCVQAWLAQPNCQDRCQTVVSKLTRELAFYQRSESGYEEASQMLLTLPFLGLSARDATMFILSSNVFCLSDEEKQKLFIGPSSLWHNFPIT